MKGGERFATMKIEKVTAKSNWYSEDCDPLKDVMAMKKIIENDIGAGKPISFHEALYRDTQALYMIGYSQNAVVEYATLVLGECAKQLKLKL